MPTGRATTDRATADRATADPTPAVLARERPEREPVSEQGDSLYEASGGPPTPGRLTDLASLLECRRTLVLSGAGISTESGIPDYRSPRRFAKPHKPMMFQQFVANEPARRRYWARSLIGWQRMEQARPNGGHRTLARLEAKGATTGVITQNVDSLHRKAGSRKVLELHGSLSSILCLGCRDLAPRAQMQERLLALNPHMLDVDSTLAPDGDAYLPEALIARLRVPECERCGGVLKPDVVFFGENVPKERVRRSLEMLGQADALLVVGSSLTVMSGMRFVLAAQREGKPVAIINDGPTRADPQATLKIEGRLGEVLPALASLLA